MREGEPLLTLHTDTPERFERAFAALEGSFDIGSDRVEPQPLVIDRIGA